MFPKRLYKISESRVVQYDISHSVDFVVVSHRWDHEHNAYLTMEGITWYCKPSDIEKICLAAAFANTIDVNYVWMDTICINQHCDDDKNSEINKMREIYKSAKCMLAFVKISHIHENKLISAIKYMDDLQLNMENIFNLSNQQKQAIKDSCSIFNILLNDDWFKRIWTLQELVLPSRVEILNLYTGHKICTRSQCESVSNKYNFYGVWHQNGTDLLGMNALENGIERLSDFTASIPSASSVFGMCKKRNCAYDEDFAYGVAGLLDVQIKAEYRIGKRSAIFRLLKGLAANGDVSFIDYYAPTSHGVSYMPCVNNLSQAYPPPAEDRNIRRTYINAILTNKVLSMQVPKRILLTNRRNMDLINVAEILESNGMHCSSSIGTFGMFLLAGSGQHSNYVDIIMACATIDNILEYTESINEVCALATLKYRNIGKTKLSTVLVEFMVELDDDHDENLQCLMIFKRLNLLAQLSENASQNAFLANTPEGGSVIAFLNGQQRYKYDIVQQIHDENIYMFMVNHSYCASQEMLLSGSNVMLVSSNKINSKKVVKVGQIEAASKNVFANMPNATEWILIK